MGCDGKRTDRLDTLQARLEMGGEKAIKSPVDWVVGGGWEYYIVASRHCVGWCFASFRFEWGRAFAWMMMGWGSCNGDFLWYGIAGCRLRY